MIQQSETETEGDKLERAVDMVEQLESQIDIFTLNKAIATILERRARSKPLWQDWFCKKFQDVERMPEDCMHPLVPDLS